MRVAILGAGVAGISTAIALKQKGFDVSIYERHDSISHLGAGVVLWPNACYVLQQLEVLDEMKLLSGSPTSMRRMSHEGDELGSIDISAINHSMGYPSLSILRHDLMTVLSRKLVSLGVDIHYRHYVTAITTSSAGQAIIHCQNQATITADIIIGADGRMASCARQYVQEDNKPVYQGFINWVGICEFKHKAFKDSIIDDYWGAGDRFGIVPRHA